MPEPKVSIVIPSYNRAEFLSMTLDSILAQTFTDFEIVFIDDGSTDNTEEILQNYIKRDSRIKYHKQENSERAVARSHGLSLASGKYVCLVDSDDLWYPEKLEKQLLIMENDPEIIFCYASVNRIDFHNKRVKAAKRQLEGYSGYIFFDLLKRNFIPSVTPMFKRELVSLIDDQVTEFIPYEDWDYWLRLSRLGKFYHIKEPLGDYRLHPGQSVQNVNAEKIEEVTIKVLDANTSGLDVKGLKSHFDNDPGFQRSNLDAWDYLKEQSDEAYSLAYLRVAYWYVLANKYETAKEKLDLSLQYSSKRRFDYRWYGVYAASCSNGLLNKYLATQH